MRCNGGIKMNVTRMDIFEEQIKNRILETLSDKTRMPLWRYPYTALRSYNFVTNKGKTADKIKPYSLFNQLLLREGGVFCTYNQAVGLNKKEDLLRKVAPINLKGETSQNKVFFELPAGSLYEDKGSPAYKRLTKEELTVLRCNIALLNAGQIGIGDLDKKEYKAIDECTKKTHGNIVKIYPVFHIRQLHGISDEEKDRQIQSWKNFNQSSHYKDMGESKIDKAEAMLRIYLQDHPDITPAYMTTTPSYAWQMNPFSNETAGRTLHLPDRETNTISDAAHYAIVFHEMIHSTKHNADFEDKARARFDRAEEELVAEIGSGILMSYLEINTDETDENQKAYCASWASRIKEMTAQKVTTAIRSACKAAEYIRNEYETRISELYFSFDRFLKPQENNKARETATVR